MNSDNCRFCQIEHGTIHEDFDRPIKQCDKYFSLASVGAFISGWSLIVPKKHVYSMRDEYEDSAFLSFVNKWIKYVKTRFNKKIIVFEHGANHCGSQTSCGTNHGHLHVVPFNGSLISRIKKDREWVCVRYNQVRSVIGNKEYLLYADVKDRIEDTDLYVHILQGEESQYFRRVLAAELGVDDFSYKTSPLYDETIESFKQLGGAVNE